MQFDTILWKSEPFTEQLRQAYAEGKLPKERLSDMVRRILRSVYAVGADKWDAPPAEMATRTLNRYFFVPMLLGNLRLAQNTIKPDGILVARAEVTNTGKVAGEEVVQLYIGARTSKVERAPKELKAFTKVALAPGETRAVRLAVPARDFAYYDAAKGWIVEPGDYEVIVGRHSLDNDALRARFFVG